MCIGNHTSNMVLRGVIKSILYCFYVLWHLAAFKIVNDLSEMFWFYQTQFLLVCNKCCVFLLSPSFEMVHKNFKDFMDLFSNLDVENKFYEILSENANAVINRMLMQKLMVFFTLWRCCKLSLVLKTLRTDNIRKEIKVCVLLY